MSAPAAVLNSTERGGAEAYDVVFVGAGAATSYTLLQLLSSLPADPAGGPHRIAVVEREPDAFSGVPYGNRSARTALIITALRDFLPDGERQRFAAWLAANKSWVFQEFLGAGGALSRRWWARHQAAVERDEFDDLFLPRYVFGAYLAERMQLAMARAEAAGQASVRVVTDEVLSIDPSDGGYRVRCRQGALRASRVVLAIGSPPTLSRLDTGGAPLPAVLVDRPFDEVGMGVDRLREALQHPRDRRPHVVFIGGNASTMDLLFQVNDLPIPQVADVTFTVLSLRGRLPEVMTAHAAGSFVPRHLQRLATADSVSAVSLYESAVADIALGREEGLSMSETFSTISGALGRVLPRLSAGEAVEFAGRWGVELGRHQRRAGWEYSEVVDTLTREDRLTLVAGAFTGLTAAEGGGVHVLYERDGVLATVPSPADIVVNCGGAARDLREAGSPLIDALVDRGVCRLTPSGVGIAVDSTCAAAPGLYVVGPLLAGNVVGGRPVWHMEHCGRISAFGTEVGAEIARAVGR